MTIKRFSKKRIIIAVLIVMLVVTIGIGIKTAVDIRPLPATLIPDPSDIHRVRILDCNGQPLSITYQNRWNYHDHEFLHEIPYLLQQAFIKAEDKRFYDHSGVDWKARTHALAQNFLAMKVVRGASTITEQVVRMIYPRPRTIWSRWLEGFEAGILEKRFSKAEILEFYLNQVPYAAQRRGVVQASYYYFNRDLDTLSIKEMLALAVLVRAPGRMDLYKTKEPAKKPISNLAQLMLEDGSLSRAQYDGAINGGLLLEKPSLLVQANHFVQYLNSKQITDRHLKTGRLITTLDGSLQMTLQGILDDRIRDLKSRSVSDGAILVVDHTTNEVLSWVNGGGYSNSQQGSKIDAILTPRQPGSTLKPFLYSLALEKGWTPATLLNDTPLASPVGTGLHSYRNYSGVNYGHVRLRDSLGNSLNIPAIRTIRFTGVDQFLSRLYDLGFWSLNRHPEYYGEGLALGNGEVTLYELVQAYATLARGGKFQSLIVSDTQIPDNMPRYVFSKEVSSIIAHILSDPQARRLEFGSGNLLRFPVQTAVKTGTSSDYRDAWAVGFSHRHTVGVWMGNLDQQPMDNVTGSIGPALILRAVFSELNRFDEAKPLYLSPRLSSIKICSISGLRSGPSCPSMKEWFRSDQIPVKTCPIHEGISSNAESLMVQHKSDEVINLLQPTSYLQLAMDPRIPDNREAFPFTLPAELVTNKVIWYVDNKAVGTTVKNENTYLWHISKGQHVAYAQIWLHNKHDPIETQKVSFTVK